MHLKIYKSAEREVGGTFKFLEDYSQDHLNIFGVK
jgi:hypothetical protein